jgi:flagellar hook-associated protein 2
VRGIQGRLRALLGETLGPGLSLATLSQVGISFQRDGTLAFDTTKFQAAATQNRSEDLAGVFAQSGRASDPLLEFLGSTDATRPGRYVVNVTSLATQGSVVGSGAANLTITAGVNDALSVTVDGVSASVTIAAGTYTAASLAAALQATINGNSALSTAGAAVTVSENAGVLTLRSNRYGSTSNVSVSGSGAADLLGSAPVATAGTDVAGTIDGVAATGAGRVLTAAASSRAQGLQVEVLGGATGERGTVTAMRGYAARMDGLIQNILSSSGVISARTDGINRSIEDLNGQRETFNRRLADIETRYRAQFTALDTMLGSMLATSNFLTQQLAALNRGTDRR